MVKGGWKRNETPDDADEDEVDYSFVCTNEELENIMKMMPLHDVIYSHHLK